MSKLGSEKVSVIQCYELDDLVVETYGRPYMFQQQDGCQSRGSLSVTVPTDGFDFERDSVPEVVNHKEMGVSFKAWLERDPKQNIPDGESWSIDLWWTRNFYPSLDMILDDLHQKGLVDAGEYIIVIDW